MQENKEIEVKALVGRDDFALLCRHFCLEDSDFSLQTNYYFDTIDERILKGGSALRIRKTDSRYFLTLKRKMTDAVNEYEYEIDEGTFKNMASNPQGLYSYFKGFFDEHGIVGNDLVLIATLTTRRAVVRYQDGELFFDENDYHGKKDYEIEYETHSYEYGERTVRNLFASLDIPFRINHESKRKRATKNPL